MKTFSTSAIMLRRVEFGENDLIITFFSSDYGKISAIAKSAKKSVRRFPGILELFSVLEVVCTQGRGLPVLQEAALKQPFIGIRSDIRKTAYASYWTELVNTWTEAEEQQFQLYLLFNHVLGELDIGCILPEILSILFQMRFMTIAGFYPNLTHCGVCGIGIESMKRNRAVFDIVRGEIFCDNCVSADSKRVFLSKGTVKQLLWVERGDMQKAGRIRFTGQSLRESLEFLETFVPYHLGKTPRSLGFLRQIRQTCFAAGTSR
ncbi:MAG: DNA repair protein RecO [Burkholderiales bacterium]|nr:MAG: DNA repair protein RecO [Burkholderiales bacterium]